MTDVPPYRKGIHTTTNGGNGKGKKSRQFLSAFVQIDLWANLLAGFLMARALVFGELLPFGLAFYAAQASQRPKWIVPLGLAVLAGTATVTGGFALLGVALSIFMLGVLLQALKKRDSLLVLAAVVFTSVAVVKAALLTLGSPSTYAAVAASIECLLVAVLTVVFVSFYRGFQRIRTIQDLTIEETLCLIVFSAGLINGMAGIQIWQISLSGLLSKFAVLTGAFLGGPGLGTAIGVFLGFIPSLAKGGLPELTAILASAGLVAGIFRSLGKPGSAAAFFLTGFVTSFYLSGSDQAVTSAVENSLAILAFLIIPTSILKDVRSGGTSVRPRHKGLDTAALRVNGLAEIFNEIADSYQQAVALDSSLAKPDVPEMMNILADRVCANCPVVKQCWEKDFYKTYKNLLEVFSQIEAKGSIETVDLPTEFRRQCGRIKEMVLAINFIFDNQRVSQNWSKRYTENREMISAQLRGVSGMMNNLAKELRVNGLKTEARAKARRRRDFLDIGVATLPKTGNAVCGDGYASIAISEGKHAVILSDGMGVGEKAARESSLALSLLEQLLRSGYNGESAVKTLNSILVLRSPEETFATVDMAIFDLDSNWVELIKIGAAPTYLKRGQNIDAINSSSLPVGILNNIEVEIISRELVEGDMLVMVTDGLLDVVKGDDADWLEEYLHETSTVDAQTLAEELVFKARSIAREVIPDDMVALVIRKKYWR